MTIIERADNLEHIILPEGYYETLAQYVRAGKTGFDSELEKLGEQG